MWAAIILIFFIGTLKLLTNVHVARGRFTIEKYVFEQFRNGLLHELVKAMAMNYSTNSVTVRYTNEHNSEITNEISAKQWEQRNLNPDVQKSNNLSEVNLTIVLYRGSCA